MDLNYGVVEAAAEVDARQPPKRDPFRVERMDATERQDHDRRQQRRARWARSSAGSTSSPGIRSPPRPAWPTRWANICPSSAPTRTARPPTPSIQAEDELAAAGMVVGAGWAGARAMTSTSGPGISLMTEFIGLGYFAEVPGVFWDITRMGPSTGLPTRISQGDVLKLYYLGHGDTRNIVLLPGNMAECFEFGWRAFDLAERLQTPVFVAQRPRPGHEPVDERAVRLPRRADGSRQGAGRRAVAARSRTGAATRMWTATASAIAPSPATPTRWRAYFARGTGHNEMAVYSERADDWENNLMRLARKHETARTLVPQPIVDEREGAEVGIISFGSADPAVRKPATGCAQRALETSYLRAARPAAGPGDAPTSSPSIERVYVVELNFDGQMCSLVRLHAPEHAAHIRSIAHCDGLPLTARFVTEAILEKER